MTRVPAVLLVALLVTGCAVGRVHPDGTMEGFIIGNAKVERVSTPLSSSTRVEGGALSSNATTILVAVIAGIVGYFSHGAL